MNQVISIDRAAPSKAEAAIAAPFFVRGKVVELSAVRHKSRDLGVDFVTPEIELDALITPRTEPGPLFDVKLDEILDFLEATGEAMRRDAGGYIAHCIDLVSAPNVLPRDAI